MEGVSPHYILPSSTTCDVEIGMYLASTSGLGSTELHTTRMQLFWLRSPYMSKREHGRADTDRCRSVPHIARRRKLSCEVVVLPKALAVEDWVDSGKHKTPFLFVQPLCRPAVCSEQFEDGRPILVHSRSSHSPPGGSPARRADLRRGGTLVLRVARGLGPVEAMAVNKLGGYWLSDVR
ncbi:hypothetical protein KCV03_g126, partial [Aureobasidium melanogenum]